MFHYTTPLPHTPHPPDTVENKTHTALLWERPFGKDLITPCRALCMLVCWHVSLCLCRSLLDVTPPQYTHTHTSQMSRGCRAALHLWGESKNNKSSLFSSSPAQVQQLFSSVQRPIWCWDRFLRLPPKRKRKQQRAETNLWFRNDSVRSDSA